MLACRGQHIHMSNWARLYHVLTTYSALLSTSLLPAASPFSASQFLKTYEDEFVEVVNAKQSLLKLRRKGGNTAKLPLQLMATRECRNLGGK